MTDGYMTVLIVSAIVCASIACAILLRRYSQQLRRRLRKD